MLEKMKVGNNIFNYYKIWGFGSWKKKKKWNSSFVLTFPFKSLLKLPQEFKNGSFPRQYLY